jgi:hypothetical protein
MRRKMNPWRQWLMEKLRKEYTRRGLLWKLPIATGVLVGAVTLPSDLMQKITRQWMWEEGELAQLDSTSLSSFDSPIRLENLNPGTKEWKIKKLGRLQLQGYASEITVTSGQPITFHVHSRHAYRIQFYRMGYYQGLGGRLMTEVTDFPAKKQSLKADALHQGVDWEPTYTFTIPPHWLSGFYLGKCIDDRGRECYIPFIVRAKKPCADFAVLLATNTYHAYNNWGGKSLYTYNSSGETQTSHVSFNRPFQEFYGAGLFFQFEYNLIRWLEKEGYRITYLSDTDIERGILAESQFKTLIIAGHNEYWSMKMRKDIEEWSASKGNLAVFSANVAYWQVRMQPDEKGRADRVMVSYKEFAYQKDPYRSIDPSQVTTRWRDRPVNLPEDRMLGSMYSGIPQATVPMVVTQPDHWLYEGTGLCKGDKISGVIGGEVDSYGGKIPGVEVIAHSPVTLYGQPGMADVIWYQKPTGGKVFSVGTFYWNWFLDPIHRKNQATENMAIQQITRNALKRLM